MQGSRPLGVRSLLREYGITPRKEIGQHFLTDRHVLRRIITAADLDAESVVVEIGPGLGSLTEALADSAGEVVAIELDERLVSLLRERFSSRNSVRIVHGDILRVGLSGLVDARAQFKVVANLPYHITSAILRRLLESPTKPRLMILMMQREVAERVVARPGEMSVLSVSVQFYGKPSLIGTVPAGAFYPRPAVNSAIVRIDVYDRHSTRVNDEARFFRIVHAGFSQRRKQLRNSLSAGLRLPIQETVGTLRGCGIAETRRPQTLSVEEWVEVYHAFTPLLDGH